MSPDGRLISLPLQRRDEKDRLRCPKFLAHCFNRCVQAGGARRSESNPLRSFAERCRLCGKAHHVRVQRTASRENDPCYVPVRLQSPYPAGTRYQDFAKCEKRLAGCVDTMICLHSSKLFSDTDFTTMTPRSTMRAHFLVSVGLVLCRMHFSIGKFKTLVLVSLIPW